MPRVANVVTSYRAYRREKGADPNADSAQDLAATFVILAALRRGPRIGNGNGTSTHKGAPLRALAIQAGAAAMIGARIDTAEDLRRAAADPKEVAEVARVWRANR